MGRPLSGFALALALCPGLVGCALDPPSDQAVQAEQQVAVQQSSILGGVADTTDGAVMALIHQQGTTMSSACTGTVIAKVGASGILLTAGHCVVANNGMAVTQPLTVAKPADIFVIPGNDWQTALGTNQYFDAAQVAVHPSYDGTVNSTFDMALVRFVGATPSMPVIPAVTAAEDTLAVGSAFTLVGYGETDTNKNNSQRRKVDRTVETLSTRQFQYSQTDIKGACSGDSGGPALVTTPNGVRVAGVTSYGDTACTSIGVSVRVSPLSAFIQSFITGTPLVLSCDECTAAAVSPTNACVDQANACGSAATACGQFLGCADACTTNSCVTSCQNRFAAGATAYDNLAKCQCTSCAAPCATAMACAPYLTGTTTPPVTTACGGLTDVRPTCAACISNTCCAEATACANDPICASCLTQSASACRIDTAFTKLNACKATCAGTPCAPATTPTGGAAGTGGTAATGGTTGAA
ncbi:MAG: Flagellar hook-length control protein FliK, partial [Myxococcales bacterium]|nr:Flagellar hook-length control protein FliK [Myxococcales bacterium]